MLPLLILSVCGTAAAEQAEGGAEVEALLRRFAAMPGLEARFVEERRLELLAEPLTSRGIVFFAPPDRLLRRVEEPVASSLLLLGNDLVVADATGSRTLPLELHPVLRAFVDTFRWLLSGDLVALRGTYRLAWIPAAEAGGWRIRLEPLGSPLRDLVTSLEITGRDAVVLELAIREVRGDETVTRFSQVDPDRHFDEAELTRLFRRPAP